MNAAAVVQLLNLIAGLIPIGLQAAQEFKATGALSDQAAVDEALAVMVAAANVELTKAEADLDAAALR